MKSLKDIFGDLTPKIEQLLAEGAETDKILSLLEDMARQKRLNRALHALVHPLIFAKIGEDIFPWEIGNGAVPFIDRLYAEATPYGKAILFHLLLSSERDLDDQATGQILRFAAFSALTKIPLPQDSPAWKNRKALLRLFHWTAHLPKEEFHKENVILELAKELCLNTSLLGHIAASGQNEQEVTAALLGKSKKKKGNGTGS